MLHTFKTFTPQLDKNVFCVSSAEIIGDVTIGDNSSIWYNVVIRGDVNSIRIGSRTNIQDGTVVHVTHEKFSTRIGDDVTIGHNATLHGCRVGNRCLIGMSATLMDGVQLEDDVMIAAGALLTPGTVVPSGTLFAGVPARYKRHLSTTEIASLKQSALNYLKYVEDYIA